MPTAREIRNILKNVQPEYSTVNVVNRGVPHYLDSVLRGQARFARRTGAKIGILNPDNIVNLTSAVQLNSDIIKVDRMLTWFELDSIISFGPNLEFSEIDDFDTDTLELYLKTKTKLSHTVDKKVLLWATPMKAEGPTNVSGSFTLRVRSRYNLAIGDFVVIKRDLNLESVLQIEVTGVTFIQQSEGVTDNFDLFYDLTLKTSLPITLPDETVIYLRAYPAYKSKTVFLPIQRFSAKTTGPNLIDYISGRLKDGIDISEVLSVELFDRNGTSLTGSSPVVKQKNFMVKDDIPVDALLFWDLIEGEIDFKNGIILGTLSSNGRFLLRQKIIPNLKNSITWNFRVKPVDTNTTFKIGLRPNDYISTVINDFNNFTVIPVAFDEVVHEPVESIEIIVSGLANKTFEISSILTENVPETLIYNLVLRAETFATWQASGLISKPMFLLLDYLKGRFDSEDGSNQALLNF